MISLLIFSLATRRLTHLIVDDEIARPSRDYLIEKYHSYWVNYLLTCPKCMSIWSAAILLACGRGSFGRMVLHTLALSEASILVDHALSLTEKPSLMN